MHLAGLPRAPLLIASEDVQAGKPAPGGYRIAAEKFGLDCGGTVVFEIQTPVFWRAGTPAAR